MCACVCFFNLWVVSSTWFCAGMLIFVFIRSRPYNMNGQHSVSMNISYSISEALDGVSQNTLLALRTRPCRHLKWSSGAVRKRAAQQKCRKCFLLSWREESEHWDTIKHQAVDLWIQPLSLDCIFAQCFGIIYSWWKTHECTEIVHGLMATYVFCAPKVKLLKGKYQ